MTGLVDDSVTDGALNIIKNNVTEMYIDTTTQTTRANAITNALASKTGLTTGSFTGPADDTTVGRKLTKNAETGISITGTGTAASISLCSASLLYWRVDISPTQALTSGGTVDTNAFAHKINDAT